MQAHIEVTDRSVGQSGEGWLTVEQIDEYHFRLFKERGLPDWSYGGWWNSGEYYCSGLDPAGKALMNLGLFDDGLISDEMLKPNSSNLNIYSIDEYLRLESRETFENHNASYDEKYHLVKNNCHTYVDSLKSLRSCR